MELINILKALGDETRIRILNLLKDGDLCVCELEILLEINQSNVSKHLNKLANAKLVLFYKRAQYVFYKIDETTLNNYSFIAKLLKEEMDKVPQCTKDIYILKKYKESGLTCDDLKEGKLFRLS